MLDMNQSGWVVHLVDISASKEELHENEDGKVGDEKPMRWGCN